MKKRRNPARVNCDRIKFIRKIDSLGNIARLQGGRYLVLRMKNVGPVELLDSRGTFHSVRPWASLKTAPLLKQKNILATGTALILPVGQDRRRQHETDETQLREHRRKHCSRTLTEKPKILAHYDEVIKFVLRRKSREQKCLEIPRRVGSTKETRGLGRIRERKG